VSVGEWGGEVHAELDELRREVEHLRAILRCAGDIIVTADPHGRIIEWSEAAARVLGYPAEEMIGAPVDRIYEDPSVRADMLTKLEGLGGEPLVDQEVRVRRADGKVIWLSLSLADLRDGAGELLGTVGVAKDISERKRLERELRRLTRTDRLTGLYNQAHFFERLEIEKERAHRLGHPLSLVYFDLDGFKPFNDTNGHQAGDAVLRKVGGIIFRQIRKEVDSGFRYGGDEFCVLLPGTDVVGALHFAERIRSGVEELGLGEIRTSLGLAELDLARYAIHDLLQDADDAMYAAKARGGNCVAIAGRQPVAQP
jgi:diguanylate cyclase (GGDEF)-like protein/PAS domain S-box-containing protein